MYNGENYMVLPTAAPEDPGTITQGVRVSVLTPIVNIGRWKDYPKFDADIDLADSYYGFETEVVVECLCEEDWDDDMGRCAVADPDDLRWQVSKEVKAIDPDAEYEIIY
jgi:hypothetical protein